MLQPQYDKIVIKQLEDIKQIIAETTAILKEIKEGK